MALPVLTTEEDVKSIIQYLKTKPTGATIAEAKAIVMQAADGRKMNAYQFFGFVTKEGERYKLTKDGWDIARKTKTEEQGFRDLLDRIPAYRSILEWAHHQALAEVTTVDIASHWHEHHSEATGTENEDTMKNQAVCFMHICQAAGIGKTTIGRKGGATRFVFDKAILGTIVEAGPSSPPWVEPDVQNGNDEEQPATHNAETLTFIETRTEKKPEQEVTSQLRAFISHGKTSAIVEQVETLLGLADIPSEVAEKEESAAIPVPDKVFDAMKRCTAGIIIVAVEETNKAADGSYKINENVLIEIGAAFVLYDRRVVLLWDKRLPVPSNLQGLYRCEFEGDDLNWSAGMKLMKAIKGFKK